MRRYNETTGRLEMTMEEWKATHRDFKGTHKGADGTRYRTALHNGGALGTILVPVDIVKEQKESAS